jgi:hypothetical protein
MIDANQAPDLLKVELDTVPACMVAMAGAALHSQILKSSTKAKLRVTDANLGNPS